MKKFDFITEKWTISKLLELLNNGKFVKLPHQRPLKLKNGHANRFIEATLNCDLLSPFIFSDLKSSLDVTINNEDKKFFTDFIDKGFEYSIEDCQHRMSSLQTINSGSEMDYFINEFIGKKEQFLNSHVLVTILKNASREELIRKFGKVNSSKPVTNDNLLWGINNNFNQFIKSRFIDNKTLIKLYKIKKNSENVKRTLYGNLLKIIKVCAYHNKIIETQNTGADYLMSFLKNDIDIKNFNQIINLFDLWYEIIKDNPYKDKFTTQSNLFFILHVLSKKSIDVKSIDVNLVNKLLLNFSDTRSSAESRYNHILNLINYEK
jgi:hypothetical protein